MIIVNGWIGRQWCYCLWIWPWLSFKRLWKLPNDVCDYKLEVFYNCVAVYLQNDLCDYNLEVFSMVIVIKLQNDLCDYTIEVFFMVIVIKLQNDLCDYNLEVFYMVIVIKLQNDVCDYNLEVLAACLQLFALDNCGVDTSGLNARWNVNDQLINNQFRVFCCIFSVDTSMSMVCHQYFCDW